MDFGQFTTSELLAALPTDHEDDRWELKSAQYLDPAKRNDLKKELGKQVSAFANSGGGYLVFGISNDRKLEPCEATVGRQPTKDFLATMVEQCVEYPIRHFKVHRIPFTGEADKSIFLIAIEDSPAAPHQAKDEKTYYYRIDGHSKPAPHFHIELLRNRMEKAVLQIVGVEYGLQSVSTNGTANQLSVPLWAQVQNVSLQCAANWGVHAKHLREHYTWSVPEVSGNLADGVCIHGQGVLLPGEKRLLTINMVGSPGPQQGSLSGYLKIWEDTAISLRPVSNNHTGEQYIFAWDRWSWLQEKERFKEKLAAFGVKD